MGDQKNKLQFSVPEFNRPFFISNFNSGKNYFLIKISVEWIINLSIKKIHL